MTPLAKPLARPLLLVEGALTMLVGLGWIGLTVWWTYANPPMGGGPTLGRGWEIIALGTTAIVLGALPIMAARGLERGKRWALTLGRVLQIPYALLAAGMLLQPSMTGLGIALIVGLTIHSLFTRTAKAQA